MRRFFHYLSFAVLTGCAIQVPPQGGDKDVDPPKLMNAIPADGSTGFSATSIEFEFDENLQLKDLPAKLVISPPFPSLPIAKVRKNRLIIELEDTLSPNTTYCFNFGDAIADLNEGNAIKDFRYVFSTGSFIDSLSVSGKVARAEDLKPEKSMLVMLYPAAAGDSAPYKRLPAYFSRCNDRGFFSVDNVAAGSYAVFALSDANQNYLYDDPAERIAFLSNFIDVPDTSVVLSSFLKRPPPAVLKATADGPGKINFIFNVPRPEAILRWEQNKEVLGITSIISSRFGDTTSLWFTRLDIDTARFFVDFPGRTDTFDLTLKTFDPSKNSSNSFRLSVRPETGGGSIPPDRPLVFTATHPVTRVDRSRISLKKDSAEVAGDSMLIPDSSQRFFLLPVGWQEEGKYAISILPGAFEDIYGRTNDTLVESFKVNAVTDYGTLRLTIDLPQDGTGHLLQLVDDKENVLRSAALSSDTVLFFEYLSPGTYRIKLIVDSNGNGRWDAGDDIAKRQPERVMYHRDQVPVRANWDVTVKWSVQY